MIIRKFPVPLSSLSIENTKPMEEFPDTQIYYWASCLSMLRGLFVLAAKPISTRHWCRCGMRVRFGQCCPDTLTRVKNKFEWGNWELEKLDDLKQIKLRRYFGIERADQRWIKHQQHFGRERARANELGLKSCCLQRGRGEEDEIKYKSKVLQRFVKAYSSWVATKITLKFGPNHF